MSLAKKGTPPYYVSLEGPRMYKARIDQTGTAAPIPFVIKNELQKQVSWTYVSPGIYRVSWPGMLNYQGAAQITTGYYNVITAIRFEASGPAWEITTFNTTTQALENGKLLAVTVEITEFQTYQ